MHVHRRLDEIDHSCLSVEETPVTKVAIVKITLGFQISSIVDNEIIFWLHIQGV